MANRILLHIESERGRRERVVNDMDTGDGAPDQGASADRNRSVEKLSHAQLVAELEDREAKLRTGSADGADTDQWRLYQYIITELGSDRPLRLMVQASAGTGRPMGEEPALPPLTRNCMTLEHSRSALCIRPFNREELLDRGWIKR
jgi:hypothetical protein